MLNEAREQAKQALRHLAAVASEGSAPTEEYRGVLDDAKAMEALVKTVQAKSARVVAEREGHGDRGVQLLADKAGLSRRDANSQAKTDRLLDRMPAARAAVDAGKVPLSNARALVNAVERAGLGEVASDPELLEKAASESPEKFNRSLRRWAVDREGDDGASELIRQRKNRGVRFFTADDGMTHMHGKFDAVTGKRIENRFQTLARRRWKDAKQNPGSDCTSFDHAMADILDIITAGHDASTSAACGCQRRDASSDDGTDIGACCNGTGSGKPFADIAIGVTVSEDGERLIGEIAGGDRLPPAVLEELMCNARLTGVLFNQAGTAIWQGHSVRVATEAQKRQLIRTYGGCFHCGAHPTMCQAHHITPYADGGKTDIDNLVLVCWTCHQRIHQNNWHIQTAGGIHTLHPPGQQPPDRPEPAGAIAPATPESAQLQLE